jgi:hypothetical protein
VPAPLATPATPAATSAPPLLGDAHGTAHAATTMTAVLPLLGDADGLAHAMTAMTDTGTYILMATKEDLREFGDDPRVIPLVLVYKGEILVSNDNTPLSLRVSTILQEFVDVFADEVHHCVVLSIRLTSIKARHCRTLHRIGRIPMKQRKSRNKYKHSSTKVIFV